MSVSGPSAPRFKHASLDSGSVQIRLFKLHYHADHSQPLRGLIQHFDLIEAPAFAALSYTWGESPPNFEVFIDGRPLCVRENLYHFLRLRCSHEDLCDGTWLFIDQICINQSDIQERNQQVARMEAVYKSAENVIAWLGLGFPGGEKIIQRINSLATGTWTMKDLTSHRIEDSTWQIFYELSYWQRLWICQEFHLAKRLQLVLGEHTVSDLDAYLAIDDDHQFLGTIVVGMSGLGCVGWNRILRMFDFRRKSKGSSLSWCTAGLIVGGTECHEKQDYVYGVMGIIEPSLRIPVDYNRSPLDLFLMVFCTELDGLLGQSKLCHKEQVSFLLHSMLHLWIHLEIGNVKPPDDQGFARLFEFMLLYHWRKQRRISSTFRAPFKRNERTRLREHLSGLMQTEQQMLERYGTSM